MSSPLAHDDADIAATAPTDSGTPTGTKTTLGRRTAAPQATGQAVAAVVCTFTEARWDLLWQAVESLRRQDLIPREIAIVVDHNPELLRRVRDEIDDRDAAGPTGPPVTAIANTDRRGLSGARNTALRSTSCSLVAFLDDDARAHARWLALLARHLEDTTVLAAGGRVIARWVDGTRPPWMPPELDWVVGCTHSSAPTTTVRVRNPFGGAMMVRRDAVVSAGGYDTNLGRVGHNMAGCEETELCVRMRQRDPAAVLLYEPAAAIEHHVPRDRARPGYVLRRCRAEGKSKALVAQLVGIRAGLADERRFGWRVLPTGVARGVVAGLRGDAWAVARAGMLVAGFAAAATGFATERLSRRVR